MTRAETLKMQPEREEKIKKKLKNANNHKWVTDCQQILNSNMGNNNRITCPKGYL